LIDREGQCRLLDDRSREYQAINAPSQLRIPSPELLLAGTFAAEQAGAGFEPTCFPIDRSDLLTELIPDAPGP
jgi:hypothetical protein